MDCSVCTCVMKWGCPGDFLKMSRELFSPHKACMIWLHHVLEIRRGSRAGVVKGHFSLFFHVNIYCDPSLEPPRRDGSNEGSQCMYWLRNKKNFL